MSPKSAATVARVRVIDVRYVIEDEGVGAVVPAVPGWVVVGRTVAEARELVIDGMEFASGDASPFELHETFEDLREAGRDCT
jgi:hypothetical protein